MTKISPLAFVNPSAKIGDNVTIEPFAFIDEGVAIGDNCHIHPHTSILSGTVIGNGVEIYDGAVISAKPQDFRWDGSNSFVFIGDNTVIREHVIINRSMRKEEATRIGHDSFIMAQTHVGHDSEIGDHCVIGNAVKIAGDCKIGDFTIFSSNALIHERCEVGRWVLIKGGCRVTGNVPPFVIMAHNPISYYGINAFILRRGSYTENDIDDIAKCYRHIYQCNTSVLNAVRRIREDIPQSPARDEILTFLQNHNNKIAAVPEILTED